MSRIRGFDTTPEIAVRGALKQRGLHFRKNVMSLPGRPDIVFPGDRLVVFVDGDFWHGYRFPQWEHKLKDFWKEKIRQNRQRDQKNFRKLHKMGWRVIRVWEHEVKHDLESCIHRIISAIEATRGN